MKNSVRKNKKTVDYILYILDKVIVRKKLSDIYKILNKYGDMVLNASIRKEVYSYYMSYTEREWTIWFDEQKLKRHNKFDLKRILTWKHNREYLTKESVKFFRFSDKFINLMYAISNYGITDSRLFRLLVLMYKRGFKDFDLVIDENYDEYDYYDAFMNKYTLNTFEDWSYWSDRCYNTRSKIIVDLIKRDKPKVYQKFKEWTKLKYRVR